MFNYSRPCVHNRFSIGEHMNTPFTKGIATAPHFEAANTAAHLLREGGNAVEAMVGAAATIAAVYPHMTAIGGDAFWLIHEPGKATVAIDACGAAVAKASIDFYRAAGHAAIPMRGPLAANTVAGTISGWEAALAISKQWGGKLPLSAILENAIRHARDGVVTTKSQFASTSAKLGELKSQPGFAEQFLVNGEAPKAGSNFKMPRLADTLTHLVRKGLADFYIGELADSIARDFAKIGGLVSFDDLKRHEALYREPLTRVHSLGTLYNMTPPTQGVVSLLIVAILDKLGLKGLDPLGADYVHLCVEATKQAFSIRDRYVTDPAHMTVHPQSLLDDDIVAALAKQVNHEEAAPWGKNLKPADTVWMGVIDGEGRAVSFIQSIYHEFGAGIVLAESGINWQNRGASFSLDANALLSLKPNKKPFHTLNPAMMLFNDGRVMPYGTMGGDGQPQTQCAVFTRIAAFGMSAQDAIDAPRWLLGRAWGTPSDSLKLERRFDETVFENLLARGHDVEWLTAWDESVGHAGALIRTKEGALTGGYDKRSDGAVAGCY
jgi:gamma-glutamyltranspeptidase/glutathione hydrolase